MGGTIRARMRRGVLEPVVEAGNGSSPPRLDAARATYVNPAYLIDTDWVIHWLNEFNLREPYWSGRTRRVN